MCYTEPIAAAIITTVIFKKTKNPDIGQLNLMFYGAAIFGFIDHLWNGELFLVSDHIGRDLLLGFVITGCILAGWLAGIYTRRRARQRQVEPVKAG